MDLAATTGRLRDAGCVFAEEEAALLLAEATSEVQLEGLLRRREAGEPLELVLGWSELDGVRVRTAPGVFVPRRRSRLLAMLASGRATEVARGRPPVVVDLCCGTGVLGVLVQARVPSAEVHAADLDPAAVACARTNLDPARVHEGDLYEALPARLRGRVDVLVVNAPYVPTGAVALMPPEARDHERRTALDGGADGLDVQRRVVDGASTWLTIDGVLVLETGATQAEETGRLLTAIGMTAHVVEDEEIGGTAVVGALF